MATTLAFQPEARDAREVICRGLRKHAVISREKFSRRWSGGRG